MDFLIIQIPYTFANLVYRHKDTSSSASKTAQTQTSSYPGFSNEGLKITDQFLALLLTIVSESGLLNVS